jgi:hypothetical protein
VLRRAFVLAAEGGDRCRPVHLLAALAEVEDSIGAALRPPVGGPLWERPADPLSVNGGGAGYLTMQVQQAAQHLAAERGESVGPAHLLVAVLDQGDPEALALLAEAGLDRTAVRRAALAALGRAADLAPLGMPPLTAAGTLDRPPLMVETLDPRAWEVLRWRQEHLPLHRLKRRSHYDALWSLESRAARRVASQLGLDADQSSSLAVQHLIRVEELAARVAPGLVERRFSKPRTPMIAHARLVRRRRLRRPRWLNFTVGWGCWFSNRWASGRDRWFTVRTLPSYRGAPSPG